MNVDPLAEHRYNINPYHYVSNNPIMRIDPDGMLDGWYEDEVGKVVYDPAVNSQADLDEKNVSGEYIAQSFFGVDQEGQLFFFGYDGELSFTKGATVSTLKGGGLEVDALQIESKVDGKKSDKSLQEASTVMLSPKTSSPLAKAGAAIIATGYLIKAAYFTGKNSDIKFSFTVPTDSKTSGFYDSMGQRGNNDKRLEPEELESILNKTPSRRTSTENQKLKAHEKATQQRGSRHSKGGKKR